MTKRLADNIKHLREAKNVSQEKMAQALNVSYQAVSKWETGKSLPDITLLPFISRYFGITIDELLMADQLDEKLLIEQYEAKAEKLQREGRVADNIPLWQEALQKIPNNLRAKECLMATYFDTDKEGYSKEIVELGSEIYHTTEDTDSFNRGQAVALLARTYATMGKCDKALEWASRAYSILHVREFLVIAIDTDLKMQWANLRFANYWFLTHLFHSVINMESDMSDGEAQSLYRTVAAAFDALIPLARQDDGDLQWKREYLGSKIRE